MFSGKQANGFNRVAVGINHGDGAPAAKLTSKYTTVTAATAGVPMALRWGPHVAGHGCGIFPAGIGKEHQQDSNGKGRREPTRRRAQGFGGWLGGDVTQKHQDTEGEDGHFGHRADRDHRAAEANRADV